MYAVAFNEKEPPTLGSYVSGLVRHGWGVLTFDERVLYLARIVPADGEGYMFEGRDVEPFDLPPIRQVPDIELDDDMPGNNEPTLRDQRRLSKLADDLQERWPNNTLDKIRDITYGTSSQNSYIINTESDNEYKETEDGSYEPIKVVYPNSPMGRHTDALLRAGWVPATVKGAALFVSRLRQADSVVNTEYSYRLEGSQDKAYAYEPKACDFCEEHEHYTRLVVTREECLDDKLPVYSRACQNCAEAKTYPTAQGHREELQRRSDFDD